MRANAGRRARSTSSRGRLAAGGLRLLGGRFVAKRVTPGPPGSQIPYPSGTPLDAVIESVERRLPELAGVLGESGRDWQRLGIGPRLYPRGGGLADHDDADSAGTLALYAHAEWREGWGGELLIGGALLVPEPNRCVFVSGGTPHRVLPVGEAAGERLRVSVIGYTRKPRTAERRFPS